MQINGVGSSHSNDSHQVTNCIHTHKHHLEGKMASGASGSANSAQQSVSINQQTSEPFSLTTWLKDTVSGLKGLLGKIWGSETGDVQGEETTLNHTAVQGDMTAQPHPAQIEAASATVQPPQNYNNNPYFSAITENESAPQTLLQKLKVRFQNITGFLAKKFSFSNGNSFQTKQEQPKEDLRKHSRYREDDLEIDCVLTDESYLLDSYNQKGEYSTLSAKK